MWIGNVRGVYTWCLLLSPNPTTQSYTQPGIDPNKGTWGGFPPLYYAAASPRHIPIIHALLDHPGADPNRGGGRDERDATPLHRAAMDGCVPVARCLLQGHPTNAADVERRTSKGRSPLALALMNDQCEMVACLVVEGGADPRPVLTPRWVEGRRALWPASALDEHEARVAARRGGERGGERGSRRVEVEVDGAGAGGDAVGGRCGCRAALQVRAGVLVCSYIFVILWCGASGGLSVRVD